MKKAHERQGRIRVGTSGWEYESWAGPFYGPSDREVVANRASRSGGAGLSEP